MLSSLWVFWMARQSETFISDSRAGQYCREEEVGVRPCFSEVTGAGGGDGLAAGKRVALCTCSEAPSPVREAPEETSPSLGVPGCKEYLPSQLSG